MGLWGRMSLDPRKVLREFPGFWQGITSGLEDVAKGGVRLQGLRLWGSRPFGALGGLRLLKMRSFGRTHPTNPKPRRHEP